MLSNINITKQSLITFFTGFLLGVFILGGGAALFAKDAIAQTKANYSDEAGTLKQIVTQSEEPVFQKDYIITGLTLSSDFQDYLNDGVEKGWWTEDFLIQFAGDYSIPILLKNYFDVISAISKSEPVRKIAKKLSAIMGKVIEAKAKLSVIIPKLKAKIAAIKDPVQRKAFIHKLIASVKQVIIAKLTAMGVFDKIASILNKLGIFKHKILGTFQSVKSAVLGKIADILNALGVVKEKVVGTIASIKAGIKQVISALKDPQLKAKIISKVKAMIITFIKSTPFLALVAGFINKLGVLKEKVVATVASVKNAVLTIMANILNKVEIVKGKVEATVASVKNAVLTIMANILNKVEIVKGKVEATVASVKNAILVIIANALGKIDLIKGKVEATVASIKDAIKQLVDKVNAIKAKLTDPEFKAELIANVKAKVIAYIKSLLPSINIAALKAKIITQAKAYLKAHKTEIIASIKAAIMSYLAISPELIKQIIDQINAIIERLKNLDIDEIKTQIAAIISQLDILKDIIAQINSLDFDTIIAKVKAVVENIEKQIAKIKEILGDANAVITALIGTLDTEDVDNDDWDFIPALKNWDNGFKLFNIPKSVYTELNILEPLLNVLSIDIKYDFTPDDGKPLNGNSARLTISSITVKQETKDKTYELLKSPIEQAGLVAQIGQPVLDVIADNI